MKNYVMIGETDNGGQHGMFIWRGIFQVAYINDGCIESMRGWMTRIGPAVMVCTQEQDGHASPCPYSDALEDSLVTWINLHVSEMGYNLIIMLDHRTWYINGITKHYL